MDRLDEPATKEVIMPNTSDEKLQAFDALANAAHAIEREMQAIRGATQALIAGAAKVDGLSADVTATVKKVSDDAVASAAKKAFSQLNDTIKVTTDAAIKAQKAYKEAASSAYAQFARWVLAIVICVSGIMVIGTHLAMPNLSELTAKRLEKERLESQIASLNDRLSSLSKQEQGKRNEVNALSSQVNKWKSSNPRKNNTITTCVIEGEAKWCIRSDALESSSTFDDGNNYMVIR